MDGIQEPWGEQVRSEIESAVLHNKQQRLNAALAFWEQGEAWSAGKIGHFLWCIFQVSNCGIENAVTNTKKVVWDKQTSRNIGTPIVTWEGSARNNLGLGIARMCSRSGARLNSDAKGEDVKIDCRVKTLRRRPAEEFMRNQIQSWRTSLAFYAQCALRSKNILKRVRVRK